MTKEPHFEPTPGNIDSMLDLAEFIRSWFMPSAVTCACNGVEPSCAKALNDPRVVQQADTVNRIADHLIELGRRLDKTYAEARREYQRQQQAEDQLDAMTAGLQVNP